MRKIKVMSIFGTRPEAIKMCPLILQMNNDSRIDSVVCVTAQHRQMLDQVLDMFGVVPNYDLDVMSINQTLTSLTANIIHRLEPILQKENPNLVLVHGDTTTAYVSALASFYQKIPVGHIEAGLRTGDIFSPFPEEMNRIQIANIAQLHFAPTHLNRQNLERQNVTGQIFVTGNTIIDSFATTIKKDYTFNCEQLNQLDMSGRKILLTAHRRENIGEPLRNIFDAINKLTDTFDDVTVLYPVHLNPSVQSIAMEKFSDNAKVVLLPPLDVCDMHNLIPKCSLIMTDSGGIQEEAPTFHIPTLCLREETERVEVVKAGCVLVVGVDSKTIFNTAKKLLTDDNYYKTFKIIQNPCGDGKASSRIVDGICRFFGCSGDIEIDV